MPRVRSSRSHRRSKKQSGGWLFSRKKNPWGEGRWAVSVRIQETSQNKVVHGAISMIASALGGLELRNGQVALDKTADALVLQFSFPDASKAAQFKETMRALMSMWFSTGKFLIINNEVVSVK